MNKTDNEFVSTNDLKGAPSILETTTTTTKITRTADSSSSGGHAYNSSPLDTIDRTNTVSNNKNNNNLENSLMSEFSSQDQHRHRQHQEPPFTDGNSIFRDGNNNNKNSKNSNKTMISAGNSSTLHDKTTQRIPLHMTPQQQQQNQPQPQPQRPSSSSSSKSDMISFPSSSQPNHTRFLGSKSFGGAADPSPLALRAAMSAAATAATTSTVSGLGTGIPPRPVGQSPQLQRYSASETLSSITYSGYLYKRSNATFVDPSAPLLDPNTMVSSSSNGGTTTTTTPSIGFNIHSNPYAPTLVDPSTAEIGTIPDFPILHGENLTSTSNILDGTDNSGGSGLGSSGFAQIPTMQQLPTQSSSTTTTMNSSTANSVQSTIPTGDIWPVLHSPGDQNNHLLEHQHVQQQEQQQPSYHPSISVTPSPTGNNANTSSIEQHREANNTSRQSYGSMNTSDISTDRTRRSDNRQIQAKEQNPFLRWGDSISSFIFANLVGKDEQDDHRKEGGTDIISGQARGPPSTDVIEQSQSLERKEATQQLLVNDSTPLLVSGLSPRLSGRSRPIKFPTSTTTPSRPIGIGGDYESMEQDDTIGHDNRSSTRQQNHRADSTSLSSTESPGGSSRQGRSGTPRPRHRESFLEANHRRYSAPIDMMSNSNSSSTRTPSGEMNLPLSVNTGSPASPSLLVPDDFYDSRDGHLWRAKYCVLEDGCLYFYRNKNDGDSAEAAAERKRSLLSLDNDSYTDHGSHPPQPQSFQHRDSKSTRIISDSSTLSNLSTRRRSSAKDLSKSPMPVGRPILHHFDSNGLSDHHGPCMWEKRVFMDCIGGVRTAEQQFGLNSFELQALDDEGESDHVQTLVLQAPNQTEMKEWIFQFHRSLASVMMNILHVFGSTPAASLLNRTAYLDIQHPSMNLNSSHHGPIGGSPGIPHSPSDKHLQRLMALSPRFYGHQFPTQQPLSHGHGRHSRRRRIVDIKQKPGTPPPVPDESAATTSLSSTPDTGDAGGSPHHQFPFNEPSPGLGYMSSEEISPPSRFLIPPPVIQNTAVRDIRGHQAASGTSVADPLPVPDTPELSAPLSVDPETEHPKPATGKYIPPHLRRRQQQQEEEQQQSSSKTSSAYVPPHMRRKEQEGGQRKYVPPHLRNAKRADAADGNGITSQAKSDESSLTTPTEDGWTIGRGLLSLEERAQQAPVTPERSEIIDTSPEKTSHFDAKQERLNSVGPATIDFIRGGCADPDHIEGSIMDPMFIPKKASRLGQVHADPYGSYGGGPLAGFDVVSGSSSKSSLRWETGAVSECGIRNSNEDAFLIAGDLLSAFTKEGSSQQTWKEQDADHNVGLFAVFDGHCGNQAARFSVEQLAGFINGELDSNGHASVTDIDSDSALSPLNVERILHDAIIKMDEEFCNLCHRDGREWESGATALVAMVANEHLVIGNLGDCRGVLCRTVDDLEPYRNDDTWSALDADESNFSEQISASSSSSARTNQQPSIFWKEVTEVHTPSAEQERARIEKANGWVTMETEIPIGQLRRMDFLDEDVIEILQRCLSFAGAVTRSSISAEAGTTGAETERSQKECKAVPQRILTISRICGELSVSRALGDRDFKASFNTLSNDNHPDGAMGVESSNSGGLSHLWDSPLFLPYPDDHNRRFQGDLVSNTPEFQRIRIGEDGVSEEFVVLACDGLWDVMDADDAVRISRNLLYKKQWTAKKAAARLAELAIHLGSSDNVTVIIIRLFSKDDGTETRRQIENK